jgi:hypothetical protein
LKWRQTPGGEAIRKIIVRLDPEEIEIVFREHGFDLENGEDEKGNANEANDDEEEDENSDGKLPQRHLCFDGKALNGSFSHTKDKRAARIFSVFSALKGIVLLPLEADKDHEIPAFQKFLLELNLKDVVVTADAMHCQKKTSNYPKRLARP